MTTMNMMNEEKLEKVVGGKTIAGSATSRFAVGDRVTLIVYPDFGVGVVKSVYNSDMGWKCVVLFDSGMIDALQDEFLMA